MHKSDVKNDSTVSAAVTKVLYQKTHWITTSQSSLNEGTPCALKRAHHSSQQTAYIPLRHSWVGCISSLRSLVGHAQAGGTCCSSSWQTDEVVFGNLKAQNKTTMTSTNMYQGLEAGSKPSSRWIICINVGRLSLKEMANGLFGRSVSYSLNVG